MSGPGNRAAIEAAVREFHDIASEVEAVLDQLRPLFGIAPEAGVVTLLNRLLGAYMIAVGEPLAIDGWLEWWWLECDLGGLPHRAGLKGGEMHEIATLDDLVRIVVDDAGVDR